MSTRWVGYVAHMRENGYVEIVVGKREGRGPGKRPRHGWEDSIKMYFAEIRWVWVNGIRLAADVDTWPAVTNTVMKLDIVGTAYHRVIYMQSNKIHRVF